MKEGKMDNAITVGLLQLCWIPVRLQMRRINYGIPETHGCHISSDLATEKSKA